MRSGSSGFRRRHLASGFLRENIRRHPFHARTARSSTLAVTAATVAANVVPGSDVRAFLLVQGSGRFGSGRDRFPGAGEGREGGRRRRKAAVSGGATGPRLRPRNPKGEGSVDSKRKAAGLPAEGLKSPPNRRASKPRCRQQGEGRGSLH